MSKSLKYQLKFWGRHVLNNTLGRVHFRLPSNRKDILVFSSRRSGSTWLMELLSYDKRTRRILEPFDVIFNDNPYEDILPAHKEGYFFDLSEDDQENLFTFYRDLSVGRKVIRTQWKLWRDDYHFFYDRTVFKLFYIKEYMEALGKRFPCHIIYLLRHPIGSAMSNIRLGWVTAFEAYRGSEGFRADKLIEAQRSVIDRIHAEGTELERYTAGWFVENITALRAAPTSDWLVLRYEDMVMHPDQTVVELRDRFQIGGCDEMIEQYRNPSFNAFDSETKLRTAAPEEIAYSWKKHFRIEEHPLMRELFEAFENGYYTLEG